MSARVVGMLRELANPGVGHHPGPVEGTFWVKTTV